MCDVSLSVSVLFVALSWIVSPSVSVRLSVTGARVACECRVLCVLWCAVFSVVCSGSGVCCCVLCAVVKVSYVLCCVLFVSPGVSESVY